MQLTKRKVSDRSGAEKLQLTTLLRDSASATHQLLAAWGDVPLLLMQEVDWSRGPLVIIGADDLMMWPLLPPGTLLQLDPGKRTIVDGAWSEFERPVYLIEYNGRFQCCHAQRHGDSLRLISHAESPRQAITSVPFKQVRVRGQLTPIFRPLATRDSAAGRQTRGRVDY
ncbi:MAG TPA: hypothetical protein VI306_17780 [Pyrinomonadaceae bacterium]